MAAKKKTTDEMTTKERLAHYEKIGRAMEKEVKVIKAKKKASKKAFMKKSKTVKKPKVTPEERLKNLENFVWNIKWRLDRYKKKDESFFPEDIEQDLIDYELK